MKANRFLIILLVFLTFAGNKSIAQNSKPRPLDIFLHILEEKFNVVFTYADENIREVYVTIPNKDLNLDECLLDLEKQTNLDFKRLNSRYIAIQKNVQYITVSGTIIDKSTKECLVGAIIYSGKKYTLSNEKGRFSLEINQNNDSILLVSYTGYKPLQIKKHLWINHTLTCELTPNILTLDEVFVNYIAKGINKLADGSLQLNIKNIETLPGMSEPDILHSIQVLPGVQSINETVSDINTRGGTNDQNLVLWDGVKMYQTGHFFGLISAFNSHLIHKTRIVKNGTSAAYAEGISGIIDMKQQDYPVNNFEVSTGINMISADIIAKIPVNKKLSLILGARHSINNLVVTPTYKSYYKRAFEQTEILQYPSGNNTAIEGYHDFSFYDLSCKLLYDISEKDKIKLSILDVDNKIENKESAIIEETLHKKKSHLNQSSILSNLSYTHKWNKDNSIQLSAFISNYSLDGTNVSILEEQYHLQKNEVKDWGVKLNSKNKITPKINLSSGYQLNETGIRNLDNINKPDYKKDIKEVLLIHSLYTETEFNKLFNKLYVRFGLRANYFPEFKELLFEPRAALNFKLNKYISLEALAEKKTQHTMQSIDYQTDFLGVEKRRWILSNNQNVPILKSQQYSLGVNYNRNNFLISIEGYNKKVKGIISPSQGFQNQYQYVYAIGEYSTHGVELLINKRFSHSNIWINYALAQNEYYFDKLIPPGFPNNLDIRHTLSLGGSYKIKDIEMSAGFNYRTGKPYTKISQNNTSNTSEIVYAEPNSSRLKDFIRLDISAKYNFKIKNIKGELGVSIWNILDRENDINIFYQQNENQEIEQITKHALGLTPNLSLRLRF